MAVLVGHQVVIGLLGLALTVTAARQLRRQRLSFGSSVLWVTIGLLGVTGALLLPSLDRVGAILGAAPAAVFAGSASLLLAVIAFVLSMRVSSLESALQDLTEAVGIASVQPVLKPTGDRTTLAVVPAYNEAASIRSVVLGLHAHGIPTLVVDDGSGDDTADVARATGASVLRLPTNLGVGGALRAGFRYAIQQDFEQIVQCDGDGQHPPDEVVRLLRAQQSSPVDLLIGSRFTSTRPPLHEGWARHLAIRLLARIATRVARKRITDSTSGLRVIRQPLLREVARHLPRHYLGDTFEIAVSAARAGYEIRELPVAMDVRAFGVSTASPSSALGLTLRALLVVGIRAQHSFIEAPQR